MNTSGIRQLVFELGADVLEAVLADGGVAAWNRLHQSLISKNILSAGWSPEEDPPPVTVLINLEGVDLSNRSLRGLDVSAAWMAKADLRNCDLRGARLGCLPHANLSGADCAGTDFSWLDVTGVDFTGTVLTDAVFEGATFCRSEPPLGLSPEVMARCIPASDDVGVSPTDRHRAHAITCKATLDILHLAR